MADNSVVSGGIWQKFELIQAFKHLLDEILWLSSLSARMKKIQSKMKLLESMGIFQTLKGSNSAVRDWIWPNFKLILDFMVVLVTFKNKEDPIINEDARVATR